MQDPAKIFIVRYFSYNMGNNRQESKYDPEL